MSNFGLGILFIIAGVVFIWHTYKYPVEKPDINLINVDGYMAGGIFLLLGIMAVIGKWKL